MTYPIRIARPNALGRRSLVQAALTVACLARCLTYARAEGPIGSVAAVRGDVFKDEHREDEVIRRLISRWLGGAVST